eukprot:3406744-Prymnesium_polylepis.1
MLYCPYVDDENDRLSQLCQVYVEAPHLRGGQTPAPRAQLCGYQGPARSPPWVTPVVGRILHQPVAAVKGDSIGHPLCSHRCKSSSRSSHRLH